MKTLILAIGLAIGLALSTTAQTNPQPDTNAVSSLIGGPGAELISFLSTGSNWMVASYVIVPSSSQYGVGGGIGIGYRVSDFVVPTMRLDYLDKTIWMPSGSLQLQAPFKLFNKLTLIPFVFPGIATPVSGTGGNNGSAVGIFGAGAAVRLDAIGSGSFWQHSDIIFDVEKWTSFTGQQIRIGFVYKF